MISIRWMKQTDLPAIARLVKQAGFPVRSEAGWRWALFDNPQQGELPAGLVAERENKLVAMIGLQARSFTVDSRRAQAINGHTFISAPEGRGAGFKLARQALKIKGYEAIYSLNNNARSSPFYKAIGLSAWQGERARQQMIWPIQPVRTAIGAAMSRLARSEEGYALLSRHEWFQQATPQLDQLTMTHPDMMIIDLQRGGPSKLVDAFGASVSAFRPAAPVRDSEIYAYQASDPDAPGRTTLIGYKGAHGLDALAQVVVTKPNAFEPAELDITDLEVRPGVDAARIVPLMINEIRQLARQAKLTRVRLPFAGRFEPLCFKGTGPHICRTLAHDPAHARFHGKASSLSGHWTPTGFEGDFTFALRTNPAPGQKRLKTPACTEALGEAFKYQVPRA